MPELKDIIGTVWKSSTVTIGIIAIKSHNGFKAYIAPVTGLNKNQDKLYVANWGAKLNEAEARGFFPNFNNIHYES